MKCPKCRKGRLQWLPPPPESISQESMGYCDNSNCDYMGNGHFSEGRSWCEPEKIRQEADDWAKQKQERISP